MSNPIQIKLNQRLIRELSQPIFEGEIHGGAFVQIAYTVQTLNRKMELSIFNSGAAFCHHRQKKRWSKSYFPPNPRAALSKTTRARFLTPVTPNSRHK